MNMLVDYYFEGCQRIFVSFYLCRKSPATHFIHLLLILTIINNYDKDIKSKMMVRKSDLLL